MCMICMENRAFSYVVHSGTAHGGFCPVCALSVLVKECRDSRCPVCRRDVTAVILSSEKEECVCACRKKECRRRIYATSSSIHDGRTRIVERYECQEVDISEFPENLCVVY